MASSTMRSNQRPGISRWWRVVGGLSMNLALGTLYGWSVFVAPLEKQFGWKRADTSMVFTIAVVVFALSFVVAGRIQDKFGPLYCSLAGGILVSLGFYLCSYTTSLTYLFICFGVIGGLGNGFGYATPIPVMAKWFPDKRGLAVGLAVGGYGAGSAIFGPLSQLKLIPTYGLPATFQILGAIFFVMTMIGALLLKNPPAGYRPAGWTPAAASKSAATSARVQPRRNAAHAHVLLDVGGLRARLLGGSHGHQSAGAICQERRHCGRGVVHHDAGGGRVRQCVRPHSVGLDVGQTGPHQRPAHDDRHLHGRHAGAVCRRKQCWRCCIWRYSSSTGAMARNFR